MLDRCALEQLSQEQLIDLVLSQQQRVAALEAKLEARSGPGGPPYVAPSFVRASIKRKQQKQERSGARYSTQAS